jgi:plasmid stability protein
MPSLRIENVPKELYEALQARAKAHNHSVGAEVLSVIREIVPTKKELKTRQNFLRQLEKMRSRRIPSNKPVVSAEVMLREDRAR